MAEISIEIKPEITTYVNKLREKAKEAVDILDESKSTMSKEAKEYKRILESMMRSCDNDVVNGLAKILSVMTGEKIAPTGKKKIYRPFLVIVPTSNPNGHDYPLEQPVMVYRGDCGVESTMRFGNHLPPTKSAFRIANESEREAYFDNMCISMSLRAKAGDIDRLIRDFDSNCQFELV